MKYKKVVVAGAGVLGSQIAYQTAYCGFDVTVLVREEDNQEEIKNRFKKLLETYVDTIEVMDTKVGKGKDVWALGISDVLKKLIKHLTLLKLKLMLQLLYQMLIY